MSVWLDLPYQTPQWLSQLYEPEEEPSSEEARLTALREIFQSDSKYITASELTSESPPTHTEIDTLPLPQCRRRKYQDNQETPRQSPRIKTTAAVQAELEDWAVLRAVAKIYNYWQFGTSSQPDWIIAKITLAQPTASTTTQQERQLFEGIHLRDRVADTDPHMLEEKLLFLYQILRCNSPDHVECNDPTDDRLVFVPGLKSFDLTLPASI